MLDHLPLHIRETIFSHVRYVDLFETARASQEWWALSVASFQRVLHAKDDFLLDQVDFCNEMMPKEDPWQWWMLMEFTKSKKLHLKDHDLNGLISDGKGRLIQYLKDKEINVQELNVGRESPGFKPVLKLPSNLNQYLPHITSLELNDVKLEDGSTVVFPAKLEVLKLNSIDLPSAKSVTSMLSNPSQLKILRLSGWPSHVYFDGRNCQNLTHLSINAPYQCAKDDSELRLLFKSILNQNKGLKSVSVRFLRITKEWLKMFPSNVVKLELEDAHLSSDLIELYGKNVLYERMTLIYLCEDWRSVAKFRTSKMSWDIFWPVEDEDCLEHYSANCQIFYVCKPTGNTEEIKIFRQSPFIVLNDLILQNNQGLELTSLKCEGFSFPLTVPRTVRNLNIDWFEEAESTLVLEDPSVIQSLHLKQYPSSVFNLVDFSHMISLKSLFLRDCDSRHLACILLSCTSLVELTLYRPECLVFNQVASDIQSVSLKRLTTSGGDDTFEDILKHLPTLNMLYLDNYSETAILKSDVNVISHLQYLKAVFQKNKEVAVHLSSLQFPYMLFACTYWDDFYVASKGMELMNEISENASLNSHFKSERSFVLDFSTYAEYLTRERLSLVFTKNVAKRFLRKCCPVVSTVQEFIAKHDIVNA